jgi:hypothetical protein
MITPVASGAGDFRRSKYRHPGARITLLATWPPSLMGLTGSVCPIEAVRRRRELWLLPIPYVNLWATRTTQDRQDLTPTTTEGNLPTNCAWAIFIISRGECSASRRICVLFATRVVVGLASLSAPKISAATASTYSAHSISLAIGVYRVAFAAVVGRIDVLRNQVLRGCRRASFRRVTRTGT